MSDTVCAAFSSMSVCGKSYRAAQKEQRRLKYQKRKERLAKREKKALSDRKIQKIINLLMTEIDRIDELRGAVADMNPEREANQDALSMTTEVGS